MSYRQLKLFGICVIERCAEQFAWTKTKNLDKLCRKFILEVLISHNSVIPNCSGLDSRNSSNNVKFQKVKSMNKIHILKKD